MFLLDTVVLSELRRRNRDPGVGRWLASQVPGSLFLSTVTIGEVERGVARVRLRDPAFAEALESWLEQVLITFGDRILPLTTTVARRWGALSARLGNDGADLMIAATALEHGLTVVTRNNRHFEPSGVRLLNPFAGAS